MGYIGLNQAQLNILARARSTYGDTAQILVSNEELCELAAVCAKFPRYESPERARKELYDRAVDEVADVVIVMDHIMNIFDIKGEDVRTRISGKIGRLAYWLSQSESVEETTLYRDIPPTDPNQLSLFDGIGCPCVGCSYYKNFSELKLGGKCYECRGTGKNFNPKED